jgi:DNA-binding winged helix-turn-helix (wHTH) protein/serine/threonine protein kinase
MSLNVEPEPEREISGRLWRFAQCEFDESRRQLRVGGELVDLESKPLDVLQQLLIHAGEVVTKEELLENVWTGIMVVDGSLATAVSKLRKALGDDEQTIILTVPRVGYRLGPPVQSKRISAPALPELGFDEGDSVPGRDQWQLTRKLDVSVSSEVWLAENRKTHERRVFKFASDGIRLKGLKREATLARFLTQCLGERADFVRVLEWNFDTPPYYLESEYGGDNLVEWAEKQGGLASIPFETRLKALIDVVHAVAEAHEIGVLHKDLKPANVLIHSRDDGAWQIKVADFGSGALTEPARLGELGITNLGFTGGDAGEANPLTGTLLYMAPEVLGGQSPTALGDVYALGVILYQLTAGDFRKPLSPGWESEIEDPLIREDIADAACGDPHRRLSSVAALGERLETLAARRAARSDLEQARERAAAAEERLARARAQRPWIVAAAAVLVVGLITALVLFRNAAQERDRANRQTAIADSVNRFLSDDLLGRSNPFQSGKAAETLVDAIKLASGNIDRQFESAPEVGGRLHQAIARALDGRTDYKSARGEYEKAGALFTQSLGGDSADAITVQLQRAAMDARAYEEGALPRAKATVADAEARIGKLHNPVAGLPVWLANAQGMIALIDNDAKKAAEQFQAAYDKAQTIPQFDQYAVLSMKQRLAFTNIRLGDGVKAEKLFRELIDAYTRLEGADGPNVLRVRLNLAQAFMVQSKFKESVVEATAIYPAYVAKLGEDHELAMQVLSTRAASEGAMGNLDASIKDDLKIHELAVKKQGPASFFALATLSDSALAQCRAGHFEAGARSSQEAYNISSKAFGPRAGLTGGIAHTFADCLIQLNRLDEAAGLLEGIDAKAVAQLNGSPDWVANLELSLAQIAYRRRDYEAAKKHLEIAKPVLTRGDAEEFQRKAFEKLAAQLSSR